MGRVKFEDGARGSTTRAKSLSGPFTIRNTRPQYFSLVQI